MSNRILVIGGAGSFGAAIVAELLARGQDVRALCRDAKIARGRLPDDPRLEIREGDAGEFRDLRGAAHGCAAIVHAINLPYHRWYPAIETAMKLVIAAAEAASATVLFPANLHPLGDQAAFPLDESCVPFPCSEKGSLRLRLERDLARAVEAGRIRAVVLRAGDYFGPTVRNDLVDRIFGRAAQGRSMQTLAHPAIAHQWAYVPDLARAAADLIEKREDLEAFEIVHFEGHVADPQRALCREVARLAGKPKLRVVRASWFGIRLAGILHPLHRELRELRYLFDRPVLIEGKRFRDLLPEFEATPLEDAIRTTLESYRHRPA